MLNNILQFYKGNSLFLIVAVVFLFFAFRELATWYWKLNKISGLLERIEENTRIKTIPVTEPKVLVSNPITNISQKS